MLESLFSSEYCEIFKSTYFEEHLRTAASKILFIRSFNTRLKNRLFEHQHQKQVKMFVFYHDWFLSHEVCIYIQYFFCVVRNISFRTPNLLKLTKRTSKIQEKNMSCERALNFDQWKILSESYKPMRVWLWLVYKFTKNLCRLRLFSEFIQTQKRYPTFLDKIRILTWKLLVLSS